MTHQDEATGDQTDGDGRYHRLVVRSPLWGGGLETGYWPLGSGERTKIGGEGEQVTHHVGNWEIGRTSS